MSGGISIDVASRVSSLTVQEAGQLGGRATLQRRGRPHFAEIGKRGQELMRQRYPNMASVWGGKGGRPRKMNLGES
jgi:hypothetical protein